MADRRRYTGTQTLQFGWTGLVVVFAAVAFVLTSERALVVAIGVLSLVWMVGLIGIGLRDRRHWHRLVAASSFEPENSTREVDLQKIQDGRSVEVTTNMPGVLSQTHTEVTAPVEDVKASFTVRFHAADNRDPTEGLQTGNDTLDEQFIIEGSEQNVAQILSTDVQRALLDIETPGTCTVTGTRVAYEIPFTRLSSGELDAIATLVVIIAARIEEIAKQ